MSNVLNTIRWLSIITGALSLFYLGHAWAEFGLVEVFRRIHEWYVGVVHPFVEWLRPVAQWFVGFLGWSLPVWWKDAVILYIAIGGATGRGSAVEFLPLEGAEAEQVVQQSAIDSQFELVLLPLRVLAWPLFWLAFDRLMRWRMERAAQRTKGEVIIRLRGSLAENSLTEFSKIVVGALIFAGLNAGLG